LYNSLYFWRYCSKSITRLSVKTTQALKTPFGVKQLLDWLSIADDKKQSLNAIQEKFLWQFYNGGKLENVIHRREIYTEKR